MSLNPAIETDLVGELVRVDQPRWADKKITFHTDMTGRVRAVTAASEGYLLVWIEIINDDGRRLAEVRHENVAIGDLFPCRIGGDLIGECPRLHILRGAR